MPVEVLLIPLIAAPITFFVLWVLSYIYRWRYVKKLPDKTQFNAGLASAGFDKDGKETIRYHF